MRAVAFLCLCCACVASCEPRPVPSSPTTPVVQTPPPCEYTLSQSTLTFLAQGGTVTVTLTTGSVCRWNAQSDSAWAAISGETTGTGPATVAVSAAANQTAMSRTGSVTIGGVPVTVSQDGQAPCLYALAPVRSSFEAQGGRGSFEVTTTSWCPWTAVGRATWVTLISSAKGSTGNGTVSYKVDANPDTSRRTATITVEGNVLTIDQAGAVACEYSVSPVDLAVCMATPFLQTVSVACPAGCNWTANSPVSWMMIVSGQAGMGAGTVTFRVADNYQAPRESRIEVRWPTPTQGQNVRVSQAGCLFALVQNSIAFGAIGGTGKIDVFASASPNGCGGPLQDRCVWSATSDVAWITITSPMPRNGDNSGSFTVVPNTSGAPRTGNIVVGDKTARVSQS